MFNKPARECLRAPPGPTGDHCFGALAPLIGNAGVIGVLALIGLAVVFLGTSLPQVED
ncbi:MAG: hypothetical protein AB8B57_10275 [Congregibacter sp.]